MEEIDRKPTTAIAILAIFFTTQATFIVNPMIASITAYYAVPLATASLVSTVTGLVAIPFSILSGTLAGRKVGYRLLAAISIACIAFGGASAYFTDSFAALLVTRAIVGAGIGLSMPLGAALILRFYKNGKQAKMQGFGAAVMNVSGIVCMIAAGALVMKSMTVCWLLHLVMIIPLVLVILFLREPPAPNRPVSENTTRKEERMASSGWFLCIVYSLVFMCFYTYMLNMSSIVTGEGLGTAATSGVLAALYSVGGMAAGLAFGILFKRLGRCLTIPLALALLVAAMFIGYFGNNIWMLGAGIFLAGFAIYSIRPAVYIEFGHVVPESRQTFASSLLVAMTCLCVFFSSGFIGLVSAVLGPNPRMPLLAGGICILVFGIIWTVRNSSKRHHEEQIEEIA